MATSLSSSSTFSKCLIVVLLAALIAIAAAFIYFAFAKQTHPQDGPAQNTGSVRSHAIWEYTKNVA